VGLDITSDAVRQIGSDAGAIVQAIAAFIGTLMTLMVGPGQRLRSFVAR
jgi:hypothetical protein